MNTLLKLSGISKKGEGKFQLKGLNFSQKRFERIAISGETGSGKSTLLKMIAGLVQPDTGEILFENERIIGPEGKLVAGHPQIAYLSQHFELQKFLRVEQILTYANNLSAKKAGNIYNVCRINHLLKRKTSQLSGGERQRIALAQLLTSSPQLLLLDEPFSNLDLHHKRTLKEVVLDISKSLHISCIMASHDPTDTLSWADRILVMKRGRIIQQGTPEKIYQQPKNVYVAGLFGKYNLMDFEQLKAFKTLENRSFTKTEGKTALIRTEHLKIVANDNEKQKVTGKVVRVGFFGSYYDIEVEVSNRLLIVRSDSGNYDHGSRICLHLSPEHIWFV